MATRVQVILSEQERERFRRLAQGSGLSLSAWMREAARERAVEEPVERFRSREDLQRFFGECDVRETGAREPDWDAHRAVLERSVVRGNPDS